MVCKVMSRSPEMIVKNCCHKNSSEAWWRWIGRSNSDIASLLKPRFSAGLLSANCWHNYSLTCFYFLFWKPLKKILYLNECHRKNVVLYFFSHKRVSRFKNLSYFPFEYASEITFELPLIALVLFVFYCFIKILKEYSSVISLINC